MSMIYQNIKTVTGGDFDFMIGIEDLRYFLEQVL